MRVRFRLILLSLVSVGLYALLAVRGYAEASFELWGIWIALVVAYVVSFRLATPRTEKSVFAIIFITSILCRGALFLGSGLEHGSNEIFLYGSSPLTHFAARLDLGLTAERALAVAFDLGGLALAPGLLKAARLPLGAAILHGWNPLVITEVAGSGRVEVVAFVLLLLALRLIQTNAHWPATIVYGASLSGPLMLLATLPLMAKALRARVVLALGIALLGWNLAFPDPSWVERAGWPPTSHLGGSVSPVAVALANLFLTRNEIVPMAIVLAAWGLFIAVRTVRQQGSGRGPLEALLAVGALVLVSPQALPWAFVPIAYLAAHSANRGWIAFTVTAPMVYLATDGVWSFWLGFAQYFVPYALLIFWWLGRPPSPRVRRTSPPHEAAGKATK